MERAHTKIIFFLIEISSMERAHTKINFFLIEIS